MHEQNTTHAPSRLRASATVEAILMTLVSAAGFSVLFAIVQAISSEWYSDAIGFFAVPLLLAIGVTMTLEVYRLASRSLRFPVAVIVAAVALAALASGAALLIWVAGTLEIEPLPTMLHLVGAAVYGVLALLVGAFWPGARADKQRRAREQHLDDEAWLAHARKALRERGDLSDTRVEQYLAEAEAHSADSGTRLAAEFGPPTAYAKQLAPQAGVKELRKAWLYSGILLLALGSTVAQLVRDGFDGGALIWLVLWIAAIGLLTVVQWRQVAQLRKQWSERKAQQQTA
ncbi:hypothetical protein [Humidisolicoccus flavus]|uniref:hypothetical protein n=1 Tax=Humidisolicoccus flavus TaxID=3111414 RepID=UPI003255FE4B